MANKAAYTDLTNTTLRSILISTATFALMVVFLWTLGCRREAGSSAPVASAEGSNELTRDEVAKLSKDLVSGSAEASEFSSIASNLAVCVESDDRDKALMSVVALGHLGPGAKEAVPSLIRRLEKSSAKGEQAALINTLGNIGGGAKEALPVLRQKAKSLDPAMRTLAQRAIEKIEQAP